jgi:hypothetical protein
MIGKVIYADCKECGQNRLIYHKALGLCQYCNEKRKSARKKNKTKAPLLSSQGKVMMALDKEFYELLWFTKPHYCEECLALGKTKKEAFLGLKWKNFHFSHIHTKGSWPSLRHHVVNINMSCWAHHQQWEFGERQEMAIYDSNQEIMMKLSHEESTK